MLISYREGPCGYFCSWRNLQRPSSYVEAIMHTCSVTHCILVYLLIAPYLMGVREHVMTNEMLFHLEYTNVIHATLKHGATGTEALQDSCHFFFILLGQKQIVGLESFPGAEFVFLLTLAFSAALVWG